VSRRIPWWKAVLFVLLLAACGVANIYGIWLHRRRMGPRPLVSLSTELIALSSAGVVVLAILAYRYRATRAAERRLAEMTASDAAPAPRKERPLRRRGDVPIAPIASPGDGPFRGAPAPTVQVIRTERQVTRPEVVPGEGDDRGPKILR
jgi:hypothetical protein